MMTKKTWETPKLEAFGSMQALTADPADPLPMNAPNAKHPITFDGSPFGTCPPGLFKMGDPPGEFCSPPGQGGMS